MVTPLHLSLTLSFFLPPLLLPAPLTSDASTAVFNTQLNTQHTEFSFKNIPFKGIEANTVKNMRHSGSLNISMKLQI
jgi:hypothetical protein